MAYVRNTTLPETAIASRPDLSEMRDKPFWVLFDDDGNMIMADDNRSVVFFFATDNEIRVHRIH